MILTGKCKKDFEKWYEKQRCYGEGTERCNPVFPIGLTTFYKQHYSMQYGVLVDFFDSVGIFIEITPMKLVVDGSLKEVDYCACIDYNFQSPKHSAYHFLPMKTRQEAREQAITKANEIYNK